MMTILPRALSAILALATLACATAPPAPPPARTYEALLGRIVSLEDRRILQDDVADPAGTAVPADDLLSLLADPDARLRRRAAIAVGRVGMLAGTPALVAMLGDPDPDVRSAAVFALGLIGDPAALAPLATTLDDPDPQVHGRAMQALGMMGAADQAGRIAAVVRRHVESGALAGIGEDDMTFPLAPAVEAIRLGVLALARLDATSELESVVLDQGGGLRVRWWPAAYALSVAGGPTSAPALRSLLSETGLYAAKFAADGLGRLQDRQAATALLDLAASDRAYLWLRRAALAALARIEDATAGDRVLDLALDTDLDEALHGPVLELLGALGVESATDLVLDFLSDPRPGVRAAAYEALAALDEVLFVQVLSGLDPDRDWRVRAALARALTKLPAERASPRLTQMLDDPDRRVVPDVLNALVAVAADAAWPTVQAELGSSDPAIRAAAAALLAGRAGSEASLRLQAAYRASVSDRSPAARIAILRALASRPDSVAEATLREAIEDADWAVRRFAAAALADRGEPRAALETAIRPVRVSPPTDGYDDPALVAPAFTPQMYLETDKGQVQVELFVLDAPLTVAHVVELAGAGFYEGLRFQVSDEGVGVVAGDPREDGFGGSGETIRDEISSRPHLRGVIALERSARDAGDSRFIILRSPAPADDGRSPVFGRVVEGMGVVDRLTGGDVLRRVQVWDGVRMIGGTR